MLDITKDLVSLCYQLIEKPTNIRVGSNEEYFNTLDSNNPNQDILLDKESHAFVNIQNKICIVLYKELSEQFKVNDVDEQVLEILNKDNQILKDWRWYNIEMGKWDIKINFNDTLISKQISENEFDQKNIAIIKGEECFIQTVSPHWRNWDWNTLVLSTQNDLNVLLSSLTEFL